MLLMRKLGKWYGSSNIYKAINVYVRGSVLPIGLDVEILARQIKRNDKKLG